MATGYDPATVGIINNLMRRRSTTTDETPREISLDEADTLPPVAGTTISEYEAFAADINRQFNEDRDRGAEALMELQNNVIQSQPRRPGRLNFSEGLAEVLRQASEPTPEQQPLDPEIAEPTSFSGCLKQSGLTRGAYYEALCLIADTDRTWFNDKHGFEVGDSSSRRLVISIHPDSHRHLKTIYDPAPDWVDTFASAFEAFAFIEQLPEWATDKEIAAKRRLEVVPRRMIQARAVGRKHMQEQITRMEERVVKLKDELEGAQSSYDAYNGHLKKKVLDITPDECLALFRSYKEHPFVDKMYLRSNGFAIRTPLLRAKDPNDKKGKLMDLGVYWLTFDLNDRNYWEMRAHNITHCSGDYSVEHPNISSSGSICTGGNKNQVQTMLLQNEFLFLFDFMQDFITTLVHDRSTGGPYVDGHDYASHLRKRDKEEEVTWLKEL